MVSSFSAALDLEHWQQITWAFPYRYPLLSVTDPGGVRELYHNSYKRSVNGSTLPIMVPRPPILRGLRMKLTALTLKDAQNTLVCSG